MMGTDAQIKRAYETEGMSPEEIAEDLKFDIVAVKAKLAQVSSKYRKDCKMEPEDEDVLNFSNEQLEKINGVIFECAIAAELPDGTADFRTRLNAAKYIRDDKKGRLEPIKAIQNSNHFNILQINESLQNARQLANNARKQLMGESNVINVESAA